MKKRLCPVLALCLLLCLSPAAAAESGALLQVGDDIYLGEYSDETGYMGTLRFPVCWQVLDPAATNAGGEGVFVLSRYVVQRAGVAYNTELAVWQGSLAQQWCADFAQRAFSPAERALIPAVSKDEGPLMDYALSWGPVSLDNEQVFFLSTWEAKDYIGPEGTPGLSAWTPDGVAAYWWFRTPHYSHPDWSGLSLQGDDIHDSMVFNTWGARPAMNVDLSRALLLIPAQAAPEPGQLLPVARPEDGAWKLIVPEEGRSLSLLSLQLSGRVLSLRCQGGGQGEGEYLSLLVRDAAGRDLAWGRLCESHGGEAELTLDLDALGVPEDSRLFLFSEREGGAMYSNYASPLLPLTCRVRLAPGEVAGAAEELELSPGDELHVPDCPFPPPEGRVFSHWSAAELSPTPGESLTVTGDLTLTAVYRDEAPATVDAPGEHGLSGRLSVLLVSAALLLVLIMVLLLRRRR